MMTTSLVTLTAIAVQHLKHKIAEKGALGFRLGIKSSGCSGFRYVPELVYEENPSDVKQEEAMGVVLYIAADAVDAIKGTVIDFVAKDLGLKQMVFHNPRAENLCGCGESFSIKGEDDE